VTSYASEEVLLSPQCAGRSAIRTASPIWTLRRRLRDAACAFPLHRWRAV